MSQTKLIYITIILETLFITSMVCILVKLHYDHEVNMAKAGYVWVKSGAQESSKRPGHWARSGKK